MDDLISRQAAIDALDEPMVWTDSDYEIAQWNQWNRDKLAIETVPSAQPERMGVNLRVEKLSKHQSDFSELDALHDDRPERKPGIWLPDNNNYITPHFVCSACGMSQKVETVMYKPIWAFCPRCGARMMEGEQE